MRAKTADASETRTRRPRWRWGVAPLFVCQVLSAREAATRVATRAEIIDLHRERSFRPACLCVCGGRRFDTLLHSRHRFPRCEVHLEVRISQKGAGKKEDMIAMTRATVFCGLLGVASGYSFGVRSALSASRRMRGGITTVDSAARVPEGAV